MGAPPSKHEVPAPVLLTPCPKWKTLATFSSRKNSVYLILYDVQPLVIDRSRRIERRFDERKDSTAKLETHCHRAF